MGPWFAHSPTGYQRADLDALRPTAPSSTDIVTCPGCGRAKASHNFCPHCYSIITRTFKAKIKENSLSKLESEKKAQSQLEDNNLDSKSLAEEDWAKERWGGKALEFGQPLTKWMRTRLGYTKSAPPVYFGKENTVTPSKPRDERGRVIGNKQPQEKKGDDDHDDHDDHHHHGGGGGMPSNLQFA